ncbi:solute carrier organic anion transporter family member 4C1-like [Xenia sp. Carnegie-2017]|uniref:solute carrier organic anion transporter family member 4C1-like n=1 Tax=Xenia sp. Carnegie-2017 TaxID=2897299 RepID=UPI001F044D30|nr:solute carrier organic anion transporter family member 4C1-like [Xenia sp. Carnegie-2017]
MEKNKTVVIVNGSSASSLSSNGFSTSDDKRTTKETFAFGWGKFRPKRLNFLNSSVWFIIIFGVYSTFQGIAAWAMPSLVLPSIERRFSFSSKELGIISAANDASALIVMIFISFYGDYCNKIRWMGYGAVVSGFGITMFALPHFMIGQYRPVSSFSGGLCNTGNQTVAHCLTGNYGGNWYYLIVFIIAMLIMGAGNAPFFSLFIVYLDENIKSKSFPWYLGIYNAIQFISPGIGYLIGGKFLSIYVHIYQPDGFKMTPRDPRWIGAWWLGFLVFGVLTMLLSILMFGFPRELPGAKKRKLENKREGFLNATKNMNIPSLKSLPSDLKELLKNRTFVFNTLGITCFAFYTGSIMVFMSKFLRVKFGLDPAKSGYYLSFVSISSALVGNFVGSYIVRKFSLKTSCKNAAATCLILHIFAIGGTLIFLIPSCQNIPFVGVSVEHNSQSIGGELLKYKCNAECRCSLKSFSPICGTDNLTYVDACHAGCKTVLPNKMYANCSCIAGKGEAKPGYCNRKCENILFFVFLSLMASAIRLASLVPTRTVTLRCVPDNKRAFATGVNYMVFKTFGLLPSSVILGHIVDKSCNLWQNFAIKGRCFDYDIPHLSLNISIFGVALSVLTAFFYWLSWYFCKSSKTENVYCEGNQCTPSEEEKKTKDPSFKHEKADIKEAMSKTTKF